MVATNQGPTKTGLTRRHDSQFGPNPTSHHQGQQQPRMMPNPPTSHTTSRNGPYPPPSAMRHPTPVIEEMEDEPTPTYGPVTVLHPTQHQQQPNPTKRFDHAGYNRNLPDGQAHPGRTASGAAFKQTNQQAFNPRVPQTQPHPQGQAGRQGHPSEEAMRKEYQERKAAEEARQRGGGATRNSGQPPYPLPNGGPIRGPQQAHPAGRPTQGGPRTQSRHNQPGQQAHNPTRNARPSTAADIDADAEVVTFGIEGGEEAKGVTTGGELVKRNVAPVIKEPVLPPAHFNGATELRTPFAVALLVDSMGIKTGRFKAIREEFDERLKAEEEEKKHLQWDVVSNVFEGQQQSLEKTMSKYNELINRFNDLAEIKNRNLQEKEDLTDRYRRAGATLSTQCVTLQSSTNQVRLPEVKRRRLITDGRAGSTTQGGE